MKKLKKLSAILLAFVMILAFAACGKSNYIGTWSLTMDLSAAMKEEMGSEFADFNAPFVFTVYLDLNKDGSCKIYVDEKEAEKDVEPFINALAEFYIESWYTAMEAQGIDRATAQSSLEAQFGMPVKDFALQAGKESVDIGEVTSSITSESVYEIKNGKFFMGSDKIDATIFDSITIDGDKMTLDLAPDAAASPLLDETLPGFYYPLELTRVK